MYICSNRTNRKSPANIRCWFYFDRTTCSLSPKYHVCFTSYQWPHNEGKIGYGRRGLLHSSSIKCVLKVIHFFGTLQANQVQSTRGICNFLLDVLSLIFIFFNLFWTITNMFSIGCSCITSKNWSYNYGQ